MNLFDSNLKIPMYCEGISHRLEKRKSGETKVVDLTLKIQPFTAQLATALDPNEYGFVKRVLFKMNDGDPTVDLRAVEFRPPAARQKLLCFATTDSPEASIILDHVKVTKIRARASKDANGWVLYVGVSFGPVDKTELEYVNNFYTKQAWIKWEEADPSFDFDEEEAEAADKAEQKKPLRPNGPAPEWDDDDEPFNAPVTASADDTPPVPKKRRTSAKTAKRDPEGERSRQRKGNKKKVNGAAEEGATA